MPASEKSRRATVATSSRRSRPTSANTGGAWWALTVGLALCATTQSEQAAASVRLGWMCAGSAAAVHNIRDRQNQVDHLIHKRICLS